MVVLSPRCSFRSATPDRGRSSRPDRRDKNAYSNSAISFGLSPPTIHQSTSNHRIVYVPSTVPKIDYVECLIGYFAATTVKNLQKSSDAVNNCTQSENFFRCREQDDVDIKTDCASVCDPHAALCEAILCK